MSLLEEAKRSKTVIRFAVRVDRIFLPASNHPNVCSLVDGRDTKQRPRDRDSGKIGSGETEVVSERRKRGMSNFVIILTLIVRVFFLLLIYCHADNALRRQKINNLIISGGR